MKVPGKKVGKTVVFHLPPRSDAEVWGIQNYVDRLSLLAEKYNMDRARFKAVVEDAFGKPDCAPAEKEAAIALRRLKRLNVTASDLNWLFGYTVVKELG